jgi:hypothetical protein
MIRLSKIVKEGEEPKKFSNEVKKHFLEIVSTYNKYQEMMDRKSDIAEIAEVLGGITEAARELAVNESDDWFDAQTVKRNMSELAKLGGQFDKVAIEAKNLDQRLHGLYEDMGHILSRYYKIGEISEDQMKERLGLREMDNPCWKGYEMVGTKTKDGKEVPNCVPKNESIKESKDCGCNSINEDVYKTILYDNKHKMFFGLVDDETKDVKFIDAKTWLKSTIKDKASDHSKEQVLNSLVRQINQFNRKVEFNMWSQKEKPTWEEKVKYLLDKGLANNVNRGGIRVYESVNEGSHGMATKLLQSIVDGDSSRAEGTKMSKDLAQHYIDWIRTSPFGKKNGKLPLDMLIKASFNWGIERGLDSKLKGELSKLKSTIKESVNEAKYGYKDSTASYIDKHKGEHTAAEKMNKGNEQSFYDSLSALEEKLGHPKYMIFLSNALRGYKVDMYKDPKIKNQQEAEEALFLLSK